MTRLPSAAIADLSNALAAMALDLKVLPGFGLVDIAGVMAAIQDLIAAAMDQDAAGIMDAAQDLVDALMS